MIKSVSTSQDEILKSIMELHCPDGFECDATFGNGGFWRSITKPKFLFDIEPLVDGVVKSRSDSLPTLKGSLGSIVFDPPFLTYVKNGRKHKDGKVAMTRRFGGYYSYTELEHHYKASLMEFHRVLKPSGIAVFKCQDIIHNHKMHCTHQMILEYCSRWGFFRLKDLFILTAKHRMPGPQKGKQRHARIYHSYFLVLQKL